MCAVVRVLGGLVLHLPLYELWDRKQVMSWLYWKNFVRSDFAFFLKHFCLLTAASLYLNFANR